MHRTAPSRFAFARALPAPRQRLTAAAILLAVAPWPHLAVAQPAGAAPAVATPPVTARANPADPMSARQPTEWIAYDDATYTPVVDDVSAQLAAARTALAAKDHDKAAASLQAAAQALLAQAERVGKVERQRATADMQLARDTHARMLALARKLEASAAQVKAGKLVTTAQLDKTIDRAARADLDRRWLVSDTTTWYPVATEPERHLGNAAALYAKREYKAAATEVRRASAYLRLESARAIGDAKSGLDAADGDLDRMARALDKGAVRSRKALDRVFARADHALAVAHRAKAAEDWSRKAYDQAGYEMKAAAYGLTSAAAWTGDEAKLATRTASSDARAIGDKLASGGVWARQEVAHAFESLGKALDRIGHAVGLKSKTVPFDPGSPA